MNASNLIRVIPDFPKPGIIFKDITPLLANAEAFQDVCNQIAEYADEVEYIAGVEARGFIFAAAVAAISKWEEEKYFEYILRVKGNPIAAFVKMHDLMENLENSMPDLYPEDSRVLRYKKALELIGA